MDLIKQNFFNIKNVAISIIVIHLTSLIPLNFINGSLFDLLILPFLFFYFLFSKKNTFGFALLIIYIFLFLIVLLNQSNIQIGIKLIWLVRLSIPFLLLKIFKDKEIAKSKFDNNEKNIILFAFHCYLLFLFIYSFLSYANIISPRYYDFGFPFYSLGLDTHIFGPVLAYFTLTIFHRLINKPSNFFLKNQLLINITIGFTFIFSLLTGSRSSFLLYGLYGIYYSFLALLEEFSLLKNKRILRKLNFRNFTSTLLIIFSLITILYLLFLIYFDINFIDLYTFRRSFNINLNLTQDISRASAFNTMWMIINNWERYLFPQQNFIKSVDSGFFLFANNFGILAFLSLQIIWISSLFKIKINNFNNYSKKSYSIILSYKFSSFIVFSSFLYLMVNSPHIMIPRFSIVLLLPILLDI
tara:strand:+ start:3820 stop:5058 length:1239 start_codon:yes stop_codon:yes gene_type:complete